MWGTSSHTCQVSTSRRRRLPSAKRPLLLCGAAAVLAVPTACTDEQPSSSREALPSPTPPSLEPAASPTALVNVAPRPWRRAEVNGERDITLYFVGGSAPCGLIDRVSQRYAANRVTLTLFLGDRATSPGDPGVEVGCELIGVKRTIRVHLTERLDGRRIVDGAKAKQ